MTARKTYRTPALAKPGAPAVIVELFKLLPKPGSEYPMAKRAQWLRAAADLLALLYGGSFDSIEITFTDDK